LNDDVGCALQVGVRVAGCGEKNAVFLETSFHFLLFVLLVIFVKEAVTWSTSQESEFLGLIGEEKFLWFYLVGLPLRKTE
jgi:hypothetical protein